MALTIKKLTNANVYFDGNSLLGVVEEVSLPTIAVKQIEHKAIGMFGTIEVPTGLDKMELKMKFSSISESMLEKVADTHEAWSFQVRSSLEEYEGGSRSSESSFIAYFTGRGKEIPGLAFKQHENVDMEITFAIDYYKMEIGGASIIEVDAKTNIYKVGGEDKLATYRANLGI